MDRKLFLSGIVGLLLTAPADAAEIERTLTTDGRCERLVIAGEDLTAQCGTALVQLHFTDGRVAVSAGTGGQAWFGLGEPERMIVFFGPQVDQPWSDHAVDQIAIGGEVPVALPASGACTYAEMSPGLLVTCDARDDAGQTNALAYRTDGLPGFSF